MIHLNGTKTMNMHGIPFNTIICENCTKINCTIKMRQHGVSASESSSGGPGFESRSGHLLDLSSVVLSSNPRARL